jgi:O-methyltransferase domain
LKQNKQHNSLISLHAIYRFNIAASIPINSEATFAQIAHRCHLAEDDTRRLLRHAMTFRIFREPRKGVVAHTAASRVLAELPLLQQWIGQSCEDMWPAATRVVDAMAKWPGSEEPNEAGFNVANNTADPIYAEIGKDTVRAQRFADAMSLFHERPGLDMKYLLDGYEWVPRGNRATHGAAEEEEAIKGAVAAVIDGAREPLTTIFVDVGGSHGPVSIALAERFPSFQCIIQDLPEVIEKAKTPPGMASRVKFMAHDFFKPQPVRGADIYYFRWILHNWGDKYAVRILRSLVPAMKHGARVIVSEYCVPPYGAVSLYRERIVR